MIPTPSTSPTQGLPEEARVAERVLNSLVGVTAARVMPAPGGSVGDVHVLTTSDHSPGEMVRTVVTALRAHLDVAVDPERISVARVRDGVHVPDPPTEPLPPPRAVEETGQGRGGRGAPAKEGDASPDGSAEGATSAPPVLAPPDPQLPLRDATRAPRFRAPYREEAEDPPADLFPPPWPERPAGRGTPDEGSREPSTGSRPTERRSDPPPTNRVRAEEPSAPVSNGGGDGPLERRLVFLGHEAAHRRRDGQLQCRVELEWGGRRYQGEASAPDDRGRRLRAPAMATLRAIEAALEARERVIVSLALRLNGVEIVEAFGVRHVMVQIHAEVDGRAAPLTGTIVADESPELSTILATLQATDRSARAVLQNHRAWGPPRVQPPHDPGAPRS